VAGLFSKVARLASSPQGQAALAKAKAAANDPKNRAKLDELVGKAKQRAGGLGQPADKAGDTGTRTGTSTTVTSVQPENGPAAIADQGGPVDQDGPVGRTDTSRPTGT